MSWDDKSPAEQERLEREALTRLAAEAAAITAPCPAHPHLASDCPGGFCETCYERNCDAVGT